ncbi:RNA-guided endonuclease InsQ/TnpB family protein [Dyella ginsengisoli]|uniref:RNA-guided endonuclease InsQ/TnpB family protein n=1 Tax=Dyella ginsengisoli TaxID=363848 RepID=UPI000369D1D9|nr:RNA-guided endonuclease TnpB family protein [Dyella ginsengisoli]
MVPSTATIERAYRVRLRLKPAQERVLLRLFGARRFVWNWAIRRKDEAWRADGTKLNAVALSREFTQLKASPETAWLAELPREPFNQTLRDFDKAWTNFFAGRAKRPRRKTFGTVMSARFTLDQRRELVDRYAGRVQLAGIGKVRFRVSEAMPGRLRSITVSRDAAGRWFGTFTADRVPAPDAGEATAAIGIDLGLKDVAVISDGVSSRKVAAPKHLAAHLRRLRRYQRGYCRQRDAAMVRQGLNPAKRIPKGTRIVVSNRMHRRKAQIGALHAKIGDQRRDHQHQLTSAAVDDAAVIAIEDLNVKAMARGMGRKAFRRGVGDAGLGEIRRQLAYKAKWHGRVIVTVDRFYPSSKTCSECGDIHTGLTLSDRHWTCAGCGTEHDRDINAAKNIRREGLRLLAEGTGPDGRTRRSRGTEAREEDTCAAGRTSPIGQPISLNRELAYRAATPRTTRQRRDGPALRVEG